MQKSIDRQLTTAAVAINNALADEQVQAVLARFGYNANRLHHGGDLLQRAQTLREAQQEAYGDQYAATDAFRHAWKTANQRYLMHLNVARTALAGDRDASHVLQLAGQRPKTFSGWLIQTQQFYHSLLASPPYLERLAVLGMSAEKLQEGLALVNTSAEARMRQEQQRGAARAATRQWQNARQTLQRWLHDFRKVSKVALADTPDALVKLGLVQPAPARSTVTPQPEKPAAITSIA